MLKQRYMLVIADATGRPMRRIKVTPRKCVSWATGAGIVVLFMSVVAIHGWTLREQSSVAREVRGQNAKLSRLTQHLENRLPALQKIARTTESSFDQVWSKSSLGRDPRLLAEGEGARKTEPTPQDAPDEPALETSASAEDFNALPDRLDGIEHRMVRLQGTLGETLEYYHDAAQLLANTPAIRPTRSPWLSSSFGKRIDPIYGYWVMHKGLDMPGHIGMEVMAPADGVVIWTGWRGGYGQTVVIDHGYGLQTHFAHLSAYLVQPGTHVRRGELVARMGSTGKSTGPHLHYEVRRLGQPLDPRRFILD